MNVVGESLARQYVPSLDKIYLKQQVQSSYALDRCEAAVHAMKAIFEDKDTQAILLIDAKNAFNSINWQTALRNIQGICPSLSTITTNTYHSNPLLFIDGETIPSCEGTTQGDTLAMAIYAVATIPLIKQLKKKRRNKCGMLTMQLPVVSYKT